MTANEWLVVCVLGAFALGFFFCCVVDPPGTRRRVTEAMERAEARADAEIARVEDAYQTQYGQVPRAFAAPLHAVEAEVGFQASITDELPVVPAWEEPSGFHHSVEAIHSLANGVNPDADPGQELQPYRPSGDLQPYRRGDNDFWAPEFVEALSDELLLHTPDDWRTAIREVKGESDLVLVGGPPTPMRAPASPIRRDYPARKRSRNSRKGGRR